jgi:hypothetical protein
VAGCQATAETEVSASEVLLGQLKVLESIPRGLFCILAHHNAPNIRPVRLTHVFHSLCDFASGNLRGVLGGKAAIAQVFSKIVRRNLQYPDTGSGIRSAMTFIKDTNNRSETQRDGERKRSASDSPSSCRDRNRDFGMTKYRHPDPYWGSNDAKRDPPAEN